MGLGANPTFIDAFVATIDPGWAGFNGPQAARWISFTSTGSGEGGGSYRFQTTFDLTGFDPATASLSFRCAIDNNFLGFSLNGAPRIGGAPGGSGGGLCGVIGSFGSIQTISSGFVAGVNTWDFAVTGDATTDGLIVDVTGFTVRPLATTSAPEPATTALVATGLLAVYGMARRRRAS